MTWIKSGIVMLPTNQKSKLGFSKTRKDRLCLINRIKSIEETGQKEALADACPNFQLPISDVIFQHLYFTSDEKIEEGDWYIHDHSPEKVFHCKNDSNLCSSMFCKKIIATTDKNLSMDIKANPSHTDPVRCNFPEPSKEFLEMYVKAYNESRMIEEVLVEYDNYLNNRASVWGLKVDTDNTIIVKEPKNSWTREEVESLIIKALYAKGAWYQYEVDEWLNKNL